MQSYLKNEANLTETENGALTYASSGNNCLDLFFKAGALRNADEKIISDAVIKAFVEDPFKTMKIIFFARDVRGGLGERRFFRIAMKTLSNIAPDSVNANVKYFAWFGRFDDLLVLLNTPCENAAMNEICTRLEQDTLAMKENKQVSLLAKWLPSVNASSVETRNTARKICENLGMSEKTYRQTLSALRKYSDIIENRLRTSDYTFDYSKQCSGAMFKYKKAFIRNDNVRYTEYISKVNKGEEKLNTNSLYPYDIVRAVRNASPSLSERDALDASWKSLASHGNTDENALAVIDGSGSMTYSPNKSVLPIDAALSLGIYFAEHNTGKFKNHFITFSNTPKLIEIKGRDIFEKVTYCQSFNECSDTNIERVFDLLLNTAVKNHLNQSDMPKRLYIISDMEFNGCVYGGNDLTVFEAMKRKYGRYGFVLPDIIFWNVCSHGDNIPVKMTETGVSLVSGATPAIFDMVSSGDLSPEKIMNDMIFDARYSEISA